MTLYIGWKQIAYACGKITVPTVKRKAKKHNMPIVYIDSKPTITKTALEQWWLALYKQAYPSDSNYI